MFESIKESLIIWNTKHSDRAKLQHAYLTTAVVLLLAAGVVGLINYALGQAILTAAIVAAVIFLANGVVWSLLQSAILSRIPGRKPSTSRKK